MLPDNDLEKLRALIAATYNEAVAEAATCNKKPSTIAAEFLRTQARDVFKSLGDERMNYDALEDARAKPYRVTVQIWDVERGEDTGELIGETDPETAAGLRGVCLAIETAACEMHDEPRDTAPLSFGALIQRLPTFRTILSRNGGEAIMRARYEHGGRRYLVTARVERADVVEARGAVEGQEARRLAALDKLRSRHAGDIAE